MQSLRCNSTVQFLNDVFPALVKVTGSSRRATCFCHNCGDPLESFNLRIAKSHPASPGPPWLSGLLGPSMKYTAKWPMPPYHPISYSKSSRANRLQPAQLVHNVTDHSYHTQRLWDTARSLRVEWISLIIVLGSRSSYSLVELVKGFVIVETLLK